MFLNCTSKENLREILKCRIASRTSADRLDEVYPGLYIGNKKAAQDGDNLKIHGITHILNAASTIDILTPAIGIGVPTNARFYEEEGMACEFLGVPALDFPAFDIGLYFDQASEFIDSALRFNGKVLVHCCMGVSRSPTLGIAYLMMKQNMSAPAALTHVLSCRSITYPNDGFLDQLCDLETRIFEDYKFQIP